MEPWLVEVIRAPSTPPVTTCEFLVSGTAEQMAHTGNGLLTERCSPVQSVRRVKEAKAAQAKELVSADSLVKTAA